MDIPFVFGGDGAFLLIPKLIYEESKQALLAIKRIAIDSYSLDLRIGVISIKELNEMNKGWRKTLHDKVEEVNRGWEKVVQDKVEELN